MIPENAGKNPMDCTIEYIADRLVRTEMIESQVKRPEAERTVARRIGLSTSTLDELRRGRIKNVDHVGEKSGALSSGSSNGNSANSRPSSPWLAWLSATLIFQRLKLRLHRQRRRSGNNAWRALKKLARSLRRNGKR